jgi:hypothetical protein
MRNSFKQLIFGKRGCRAVWLTTGLIWLMIAGCSFEDPEMPSFYTRVTIPIGTHDMTVTEMIEEQDYLFSGSDSLLYFKIEGDPTEVSLDLDLSADLDATSIDATIGPIELDNVGPIGFSYRLGDLVTGFKIDVPSFEFDERDGPTEVEGINSAEISAGNIELMLTNGLPVPVSGESAPNLLVAQMINPLDDSIIVEIPFPYEIGAGETVYGYADMSGATLPSEISVRLAGGSPGADGVELDLDAAIELMISITDLEVSSATAEIGAQEFSETNITPLPDDLQIIEAYITEGALNMSFHNDLPIPCTLTIGFGEIYESDNTLVERVVNILPNGDSSETVDLAGTRISSGSSGVALTDLSYSVLVESDPSAGPVTINATDALSADIAQTTLVIGEVRGIIPEQVHEFDPVTEEADLPNELDGLTLSRAEMIIEVDNGTGIAGVIDFVLTGTTLDGETTTLTWNDDLAADAVTTIVINEANSNLDELLSDLPEFFTFSGSVIVGGDGNEGFVRPGDSASIDWEINAPILVSMENTMLDRDPEELDFDQDMRADLDDHLVSAQFIVDIENHFPFGMDIVFQVAGDTLSLLDNPDYATETLTVAAGEIDPVTGYVIASTVSSFTVDLDQADVRAFTQPEAWTTVVATIPGTNGQDVALRLSDFMAVTGIISAEILVEEDDDE